MQVSLGFLIYTIPPINKMHIYTYIFYILYYLFFSYFFSCFLTFYFFTQLVDNLNRLSIYKLHKFFPLISSHFLDFLYFYLCKTSKKEPLGSLCKEEIFGLFFSTCTVFFNLYHRIFVSDSDHSHGLADQLITGNLVDQFSGPCLYFSC